MNAAFTAEVHSIRSTHTRLETRIATLERTAREGAGGRTLATRPVEPPARRADPNRVKPDHQPKPSPAEARPPRPSRQPKVPTPAQPPSNDVELHIGRVWLVRIGIVVLLTGLVFLGNFAYHEFVPRLGPVGKLSLLALAAAALAAIGHLVRLRPTLTSYGRVLTGGALATAYYTAYAAHFVEPLQVIGSPLLGGTLLLASAAAILWLADRLRSQTIAAVTISLAFYTAAINPLSQFSLFSNLLLAIVGVALLLRHRWTAVTYLSLAGTYGAFAFWRLVNTGTVFTFDAPTASLFGTAIAFPACYWAVFTTAIIQGRDRAFAKDQLSTFLTLNNAAFYGLIAPVIVGTHPDALGWSTVGFGAILLGLSRLNPAASGPYLTQGLGLISAGVLLAVTGYQAALIFAFQSALLLKLSRASHGSIYQGFAGLTALLATAVAASSLVDGEPYAALVASAVVAILIGNAVLFKYQRKLLARISLQWRAAAFAGLATCLASFTIFQKTSGDPRLACFLAAGLVATFAVRLTRLPELAIFGQTLLIAGQLLWFVDDSSDLLGPVAISGIALIHWWQHQRVVPADAATRLVGQTVHTILPLAAIGYWSAQLPPSLDPSIFFAGLALGTLTYGLKTRAATLAMGSALFTLVSFVLVGSAIQLGQAWTVPVVATALIAAQTLVLAYFIPAAVVPRQILRILTLALAAATGLSFLPEPWHFLTFTMAGFGLFALASRTSSQEFLLQSAALGAVGLRAFAFALLEGEPAFAPDVVGFFGILAAQQLNRHRATALLEPKIQTALVLIGLGGLWLVVGRLASDLADGILITASWSLLATAILALGFALRERTYRHVGLGILLCSLVRLVLVDVWQFDTLTRIFGFVVLGAVLLAIGFFYNRFADALRRWL